MNLVKKGIIGLSIVLGTSVAFSKDSDQNLLSNPGFEDSLESWEYIPDFGEFGMSEISLDDPSAVHSGKRGAKLTVTEIGVYDWHVRLAIPCEWKAVKNQNYRLTFWAKSQTPSIKIPLKYTDGFPEFTEMGKKVFTFSPDWKQYEFEFTSHHDGPDVVHVAFHLGMDTNVYYFDDFVLNTVGEISIKVRIPQKNLRVLETDNSPNNIWDIKGRNVGAAFLNKRQKGLPFFVFQKRQKFLPVIDFQ